MGFVEAAKKRDSDEAREDAQKALNAANEAQSECKMVCSKLEEASLQCDTAAAAAAAKVEVEVAVTTFAEVIREITNTDEIELVAPLVIEQVHSLNSTQNAEKNDGSHNSANGVIVKELNQGACNVFGAEFDT